MERDMRDPSTLGYALLTAREQDGKKRPLSEIAEEVDRGIMGYMLINPAFLNGRSSERLEIHRS